MRYPKTMKVLTPRKLVPVRIPRVQHDQGFVMEDPQNIPLDQLADLIVDRLLQRPHRPDMGGAGREVQGPSGEPLPGLPDIPGSEVVPTLYRRSRLAIEGSELSQCIQYYATGDGNDNSVPHVALQ